MLPFFEGAAGRARSLPYGLRFARCFAQPSAPFGQLTQNITYAAAFFTVRELKPTVHTLKPTIRKLVYFLFPRQLYLATPKHTYS